MNPNTVHFDRGILLRTQGRNDMAVQEFRQHLLGLPDDALAHVNLSLCLTDLKQFAEARSHAEQAVALAPDESSSYFALARCAFKQSELSQALDAIEAALRLDAYDPDYFSLRGWIWFGKHRWTDALSDANAGLTLDPDHVGCLNLRAQALVMCSDRASAAATLGKALERHPENASLHANTGWAALERGNPDEAMCHFREALRLQPNLEWARHGIVEAMKARSFVYRIFLRWLFMMMKLPPRVQVAIVVGALLAGNFGSSFADSQPALAPYIWALLLAYAAFAILTWTADNFFNLLLTLNRFGRLALSRAERRDAYFFGGWAAMVVGFVAWIVAVGNPLLLGFSVVPAILSLIAVVAVLKTPALVPRLVIAGLALVWSGMNIYIATHVYELGNQLVIHKRAHSLLDWTTPLFLGLQFLSQYFIIKRG